MKNAGIPIFIIVLIGLFAGVLISYQVRETELAFVTRFEEPVRQMTKPGLYFKWPPPIERVHRYDARLHVFVADPMETTTKGAVPVIVKTYVVWRVADPLTFYKSVDTIQQAENKLYNQINDTQNRVIGQHTFGEFVNSDPAKIRITQIQDEMLTDLKTAVETEYGIEVKTFGIKRLNVSEDVSEKVFARMKAARELETTRIETEGEAAARTIEEEARRVSDELLSAAQARARIIRGQGDAEAAAYYKVLEQSPEFAMFLERLRALKEMFKDRTTLMIPVDAEPFKLLKEMPDPNHL